MPNYLNSYLPGGGGDATSSFFSKGTGTGTGTNYMMIVGLCLIFVILAVFVYYYVIKPSLQTTYHANSEHVPNGTKSNQEAELMFFYADWCPHCKAAKPVWSDLKSEYENKTINGYHVIFTEIDCSNQTSEVEKLMDQYNIEGFPTVKLIKDGQVHSFDANISKENLTQFLTTVL